MGLRQVLRQAAEPLPLDGLFAGTVERGLPFSALDELEVRPDLSRMRWVSPLLPDVVVRKARIFTFASPRTLAICASIPGRFSWETVGGFVRAIRAIHSAPL
jgi:hypothetical protein